MNEASVWQSILSQNWPLVLLAFSGLFVVLGWMTNRLVDQQKELQTQREKLEATHISALVDKVDELVRQIKKLFDRHDDHEERLDRIENELGSHVARCQERERSVGDRLTEVNRRAGHVKVVDRMGRED